MIGSAALFVFIALFALLGGGVVLLQAVRGRGARLARRRLASLAPEQSALRVDAIRRESMSAVPWLHETLSRMNWAEGLQRTISQAAAPGTPGVYVLACAVFGAVSFYVFLILFRSPLYALPASAGPALLPLLWLRRKRRTRMDTFQRQLPDALDLVARALRAGHTFEGGLRMVCDEFEDPMGTEFAKTMDEINFGLNMDQALNNLLARVDCPDLKFFVVSVNIQRETGGNLAEIVGNIAQLVRERFKLFGKVRVLSAEGRLSAMILLALPFVIAGVIHLLNPTYMLELFNHPVGKAMLVGAMVSMSLGYVVIRRMVRIKV